MRLSVIIPFHEPGWLLKRAIESICSQLTDEAELIVIGDGIEASTAQEIQQDFPLAIVLISPTKGANAARTEGLKNASGEYILFVDSDDELSYDALHKYLSIIKCCQPDLIIANTQRLYTDGKKETMYKFRFSGRLINKEQLNVSDLYRFPILINKCFRKSLLQPVYLPDSALFQDAYLCALLFKNATTIYFSNDVLYFYHVRKNSTSRQETITEEKLRSVAQLVHKIPTLYPFSFSKTDRLFLQVFSLRLYFTLILRSFSLANYSLSKDFRQLFLLQHGRKYTGPFHPQLFAIQMILSKNIFFKLYFFIKSQKLFRKPNGNIAHHGDTASPIAG